MIVCKHCLEAIQSHEGNVFHKSIDYDDERLDENGECQCEWCEKTFCDSELVEILV